VGSNRQILKKVVTGLFPGSSCFTVPICVRIGRATFERQKLLLKLLRPAPTCVRHCHS
jgi:hypothetical protein